MESEKPIIGRYINGLAEAQDYDEICPDEPMCKENTMCHIIGALAIVALVVALITTGIFLYN